MFNGLSAIIGAVLRKSAAKSIKEICEGFALQSEYFLIFISLYVELPDITGFGASGGVAYWKRNYCERS